MASTNFTTHYSIPLPLGTDLTTPMDYNEAAEDIDTALFGAVTDAGNASERASEAVNTANTASAAVDEIESDLSLEKAKIVQLQTRMTAAENDIDDVYTDVTDMITAYKEPSATSTHAYAIGDYFIYNETLYKATAAIAIGATIVPNTNCETTNISSELIQINSDLGSRKIIKTVTGDAGTTLSALVHLVYSDAKALADAGKEFILEIDGVGWGYLNCRYVNRNAENTIFNTMSTFFYSGNVINYGISLRPTTPKIEQNNPSATPPYLDLSNEPSTGITLKLIEVI